MTEINSYEEFDKEYNKRQKNIEKLLKKIEIERQKLMDWSIETVISLSHKSIYRK